MLRTASSHALHLITEAALGILGAIVLGGFLLAWRLSQGPIDITWLARREAPRLVANGAQLTIGRAALAWEGFVDPGSAIDVRWQDVSVTTPDGTSLARLPAGRVTLSPGALLIAQIAPRTIQIDAPSLALLRRRDGSVTLDVGDVGTSAPVTKRPGGGQRLLAELTGTSSGPTLPFLSQLAALHIDRGRRQRAGRGAGRAVAGARGLASTCARMPGGGVSGQAVLDLQAGAAHATLRARAELAANGTHISAGDHAALAGRGGPRLAAIRPGRRAGRAGAGRDGFADLTPDFTLRAAQLSVQVGAGTLTRRARQPGAGRGERGDGGKGRGRVRIAEPAHRAQASARRASGAAGDHGAWPRGARRRAGAGADFAVDLDRAAFRRPARLLAAGHGRGGAALDRGQYQRGHGAERPRHGHDRGRATMDRT